MSINDPMATRGDLVDVATTGLQEAVRTSTVGIVSGSDAVQWIGIGAGSLIRWNDQYLILTAEHVIRETRHDDLRFFFPFPTPPSAVERDAIKRIIAASASGAQPFRKIDIGRVVADADLDMAILHVDGGLEATYPCRFLDIVAGGQTPPQDTDILATGFPRDIARATGPGMLMVFSHTEWTKVGALRAGLPNFDPSLHFLADYLTATDYEGANPTGLSGSGVWFHRTAPHVWHPNLDLAGLTISWYQNPRLLKIVRREAIESFLNAHC